MSPPQIKDTQLCLPHSIPRPGMLRYTKSCTGLKKKKKGGEDSDNSFIVEKDGHGLSQVIKVNPTNNKINSQDVPSRSAVLRTTVVPGHSCPKCPTPIRRKHRTNRTEGHSTKRLVCSLQKHQCHGTKEDKKRLQIKDD